MMKLRGFSDAVWSCSWSGKMGWMVGTEEVDGGGGERKGKRLGSID